MEKKSQQKKKFEAEQGIGHLTQAKKNRVQTRVSDILPLSVLISSRVNTGLRWPGRVLYARRGFGMRSLTEGPLWHRQIRGCRSRSRQTPNPICLRRPI